MNFFEAILFGIVQGITEFLPVSSSGHLTLLGKIFKLSDGDMMSLTTLLHMGTLIAVFIVMRREIGAIFRDIFGKKTWMLIVATIPAVLAAVFLGDELEALFGGDLLGYFFLATALILLAAVIFWRKTTTDQDVGYPHAIIGGLAQAISIAPGISRSGATITALLLSGVNREKAIRFSFLMSIPAILGGFALDMKKLLEGQGTSAITSLGIENIIIGVVVAAVSGWLVMEFMIKKLNRRGFLYCVIYLIILGALILIDQNLTHFVF